MHLLMHVASLTTNNKLCLVGVSSTYDSPRTSLMGEIGEEGAKVGLEALIRQILLTYNSVGFSKTPQHNYDKHNAIIQRKYVGQKLWHTRVFHYLEQALNIVYALNKSQPQNTSCGLLLIPAHHEINVRPTLLTFRDTSDA